MMTNILTIAKRIIQPVTLAIAMLMLTPIVGLLSAALKAPGPVQYSSSETVVYKTNTSVAYKS
jgi:hypothetical protein